MPKAFDQMRALLDVNVLIALFDPDHAFNSRARRWWDTDPKRPWASCPLTENGVVRVISNPSYSASTRFAASTALDCLRDLIAQSNHEFWSDNTSLTNNALFRPERLLSSRHLTDLYLLGLAVSNQGVLVTFDNSIPLSPVIGATSSHIMVLS